VIQPKRNKKQAVIPEDIDARDYEIRDEDGEDEELDEYDEEEDDMEYQEAGMY
jgi:hypothetical protein